MKYTLQFSPRALADLEKIKKSGDQARIKKLRLILEELTEYPLTGIGNPERLKYRTNTYSRRYFLLPDNTRYNLQGMEVK